MIIERDRRPHLERRDKTRMVFAIGRQRLISTTQSGRELRTVRCDLSMPTGSTNERIAGQLLYADLSKDP